MERRGSSQHERAGLAAVSVAAGLAALAYGHGLPLWCAPALFLLLVLAAQHALERRVLRAAQA